MRLSKNANEELEEAYEKVLNPAPKEEVKQEEKKEVVQEAMVASPSQNLVQSLDKMTNKLVRSHNNRNVDRDQAILNIGTQIVSLLKGVNQYSKNPQMPGSNQAEVIRQMGELVLKLEPTMSLMDDEDED